MTAHVIEAAIAILGPAANWTSQARSERVRKWASVIGLAALPFVAASLCDSPQWGLQVVASVSALARVWGFWTNWIRPVPQSLDGMGTVQLPPASKLPD